MELLANIQLTSLLLGGLSFAFIRIVDRESINDLTAFLVVLGLVGSGVVFISSLFIKIWI